MGEEHVHLGWLARLLWTERFRERTLNAVLELNGVRPTKIGRLQTTDNLVEVRPACNSIGLDVSRHGRVKLLRRDAET